MATTTAPTPAAVSPRTAAAALDIEESTIRQAIHTGALPAAKVGNRVRIGKADLAAWFAEHLLKQQEAERPTAGTEVEHLQGCGCEDREGGPALMYDERTVIQSGLMVAILNELEKRLRDAGRPVLQYRRERWTAAAITSARNSRSAHVRPRSSGRLPGRRENS